MKITTTRICPSGARRLCPTPELCQYSCNLETAEGGRYFDSSVHKEPHPPRRPPTFRPDYEIEHTKVSHHLTPLGWLVAIASVAAFVWAAINQFNH